MSKSRGASTKQLRKRRAALIKAQDGRCCWCGIAMLPPGTKLEGGGVHPDSATLEHLKHRTAHAHTAAACFACNSADVRKSGGQRRAISATAPQPANSSGVPDSLAEALLPLARRERAPKPERSVKNAHAQAAALRGFADRAARLGDFTTAERMRARAWALIDAALKRRNAAPLKGAASLSSCI